MAEVRGSSPLGSTNIGGGQWIVSGENIPKPVSYKFSNLTKIVYNSVNET
jgi:hypothetical protein